VSLARLLSWFVLAVGITGCASSDFMVEIPKPKIAPDPSKATVVFLRPKSTAPNTNVTILDGSRRFLGDSLPGGCFVTKLAAGEHLFVGWGANTTALTARLEPGNVYYVDVVMRLGSVSSRANLLGVDGDPKGRARVREALEDCTFYRVDEAAGQAWVRSKGKEALERVRFAQEIAARFSAAERKSRSLDSEDGRTE
jgi:hypothetical protein